MARADRLTPTSAVPNYLGWAIVCTIVFFVPAGVVGIVWSLVARRRALAGDLDGALRASHTAKTACWFSLIVGLIIMLFLVSRVLFTRA